MKKYQMPNVKEVRLESSLFIMEGGSPGKIGQVDPFSAPKVQHGI